ncbi:putative methionine--tRNA ligase [Helianthus anomalus]
MLQLYCDTCQKFLAGRLVEGSCPTPVCVNSLHIRDTNHLFLQLLLLEGKVRDFISSMSVAGSWSQNTIQATNAWLKEGLRERCITRDLM